MSTLSSESSPIASSPPIARQVILQAAGVRRVFKMPGQDLEILRGVDLTLAAGELVAIEGRSGSGKSTLLHILGALDTPDSGSIVYQGRDIASMSGEQRSRLRNTEFGFVFQFYHLLPELNVLENTLLSAMVQYSWFGYRSRKAELREKAVGVLRQLGMDHRLSHHPNRLSGGERQRVAIARALMNEPRVLFADEPTGNLDFETGRQIMNLLETLHREKGQTIVMVTHDRSLAREADRVLVLFNGRLNAAAAADADADKPPAPHYDGSR